MEAVTRARVPLGLAGGREEKQKDAEQLLRRQVADLRRGLVLAALPPACARAAPALADLALL